jgi:hypothetical protein
MTRHLHLVPRLRKIGAISPIPYTGWSKTLCAPDDYNTATYVAQSDNLAADRKGQGDTRLTLTPSAIRNSNYVIIVIYWNCSKYFCMLFYCNHQMNRDFFYRPVLNHDVRRKNLLLCTLRKVRKPQTGYSAPRSEIEFDISRECINSNSILCTSRYQRPCGLTLSLLTSYIYIYISRTAPLTSRRCILYI